MFTAKGASHFSAATQQRNDRDADFRCGANPQRGESSWAFRLRICAPSPEFSPQATSSIATNSAEMPLDLTVPQLRAVTLAPDIQEQLLFPSAHSPTEHTLR